MFMDRGGPKSKLIFLCCLCHSAHYAFFNSLILFPWEGGYNIVSFNTESRHYFSSISPLSLLIPNPPWINCISSRYVCNVWFSVFDPASRRQLFLKFPSPLSKWANSASAKIFLSHIPPLKFVIPHFDSIFALNPIPSNLCRGPLETNNSCRNAYTEKRG